jgi:hypothetical protein
MVHRQYALILRSEAPVFGAVHSRLEEGVIEDQR